SKNRMSGSCTGSSWGADAPAIKRRSPSNGTASLRTVAHQMAVPHAPCDPRAISLGTTRPQAGTEGQLARLEGLSDEPRPGAPRKITDKQVERVITKTLEERGPGEDTHWSTQSMAAATGMSQSAISRIWRAFGLKPHLVETWKLS